jgi:Glycosyl transferase family 2
VAPIGRLQAALRRRRPQRGYQRSPLSESGCSAIETFTLIAPVRGNLYSSRANRTWSGGSGLVCLLPVRDAAEDIPDYLASAAGVCDAIVALDDGSVDETRDLLAASPLVEILLTNPRGRGYRAWDDGANRNRLLTAAAKLRPDWILSLDADERIDEGDAHALREFLDGDALPGCAYGLQHVRMWGEDACEGGGYWIYRLFAYEQGQVFPTRRLHFNPVPTSIPRRAWIRTTIRVKHFGASSERRRLARLAKYGQADPGGPTDFGGLNASPRELLRWRPRPPGLPVIVEP